MRDAIVVGASAGGVRTLQKGKVYVAPADRHLLVERGRLRLTRGPRENRVRPCIDTLFRSAAVDLGPRVVGVVLSGALDDGTAGLWAIKDRGGVAVVQDPAEAEFPDMPKNALTHVDVDHVLPVDRIGSTLAAVTAKSIPRVTPVPRAMAAEAAMELRGNALKQGVLDLGQPSPNSCPECHGSLVEIREGSYRALSLPYGPRVLLANAARRDGGRDREVSLEGGACHRGAVVPAANAGAARTRERRRRAGRAAGGRRIAGRRQRPARAATDGRSRRA